MNKKNIPQARCNHDEWLLDCPDEGCAGAERVIDGLPFYCGNHEFHGEHRKKEIKLYLKIQEAHAAGKEYLHGADVGIKTLDALNAFIERNKGDLVFFEMPKDKREIDVLLSMRKIKAHRNYPVKSSRDGDAWQYPENEPIGILASENKKLAEVGLLLTDKELTDGLE